MKALILVTLTILLLCGLAGAQNTFCSANGSCTVTGNWTFLGPNAPITPSANIVFTGDNRDRSANGVYYTSPEIDPTKNICSAINAGWIYAVAKGWSGVTIDARAWHGTQDTDLAATQANPCFKDFPYTSGSAPQFSARILFAADVTVLVHSTFNPLNTTKIEGGSAWQQGSPAYTSAAMIQAANDFPTSTPVVEYSNTGSTGTNPRGIWVSGIGVNCVTPNGTFLTGSIGIRNQNAQELSGGDHVHIQGCNVGLDIENSGTSWEGAQNSGPWNNIAISAEGLPNTSTNYIGVRYGSLSTFLGPFRGIHGLTITGPATNTVTTPLVAVDGFGFSLTDAHLENGKYGVQLGQNHGTSGTVLQNIDCIADSASFQQAACIDISSATGTNTVGAALINIHASNPNSLITLADHQANGVTIPQTNQEVLGFYVRDPIKTGYGTNATVITSSPAVASTISITGNAGTATTATSCPTCTGGATVQGAGLGINLGSGNFAQAVVLNPNSTAGVTATLPASPPTSKWYVTVVNGSGGTSGFPVFIDPNGVNLMGSTGIWTIPPQGSCTIYTSGTSYYGVCGTSAQSTLVNQPNVQNFTTSSGDQNFTCRVTGGVCPAGMYRITIHATVTAAGTAGTFQPYCAYTDQSSTGHNPVNATAIGLNATSLTTIGNTYAGQCVVESKGSGSNIKWGVSFAGATGTPSVRGNATAERISIQ